MNGPGPLENLDPNILRRSPHRLKMSAEKPLPQPPFPLGRTKSDINSPTTFLDNQASPSPSDRPSLKKRMTSRKKTCIVNLPPANEEGQSTNRQAYLKPDEVESRLQRWEDAGFDTRGFVVVSPVEDALSCYSQGQSRAMHPSPEDEALERSKRPYRWTIPNKREWDTYVERLREETLRALGVSSSEDDLPSRKSPALSLMDRLASPRLDDNLPRQPSVAHFPRYPSALQHGENDPGSASQSSVLRSPIQHPILPSGYVSQLGSKMDSLRESHELPHSLVTSPAPRATVQVNQVPGKTDVLGAATRPSHQPVHVLLPQPHVRRYESLTSFDGTHDRDVQKHEGSHIVTPIPRGHYQSPSASLQREVEEAEAYLEEQDLKACEPREPKSVEPEGSVAFEPHNRPSKCETGLTSVDHSLVPLDASTNGDNIEQEPHQIHGSDDQMKSTGHQSADLSSTSRLNVNAPEFKFEPKSSTEPSSVTPLPGLLPGKPVPATSGSSSLAKESSVARTLPKLNAAAPAFTPGSTILPSIAPVSRVFSFGSDSNVGLNGGNDIHGPRREFSFSKAANLNPDAPAFNPTNSTKTSEPSERGDRSQNIQKIFGHIDLTEHIQPAKRSKALPIIVPQAKSDIDEEADGLEDESGRITQPDARQKRRRRDVNDGDEIPKFASPGPHDLNHSPVLSGDSRSSSSDRPEPTPLDAAKYLLEEIIDDLSASNSSDPVDEHDPSSLGRDPDAAPLKHARKVSVVTNLTSHRPGLSDDVRQASDSLLSEPSPTRTTSCHGSSPQPTYDEHCGSRRSSSSASNPRPSVNERSVPDERISRKDHALGQGSIRANIMDGVRYVNPSYDEIDAVMKHLNQEGDSDLGIEREPSPRRRRGLIVQQDRSPREALQAAVTSQLKAPSHMRSDAPSPSPNRLREPFQYLPPTDTESADSADIRTVAHNARFSPSYRPSRSSEAIHRLNSPGSTPPSDWNQEFSSVDEDRIRSRTDFFDLRVNGLVSEVVRKQLSPVEAALADIQQSLVRLSKDSATGAPGRRPRSAGAVEAVDSDADDEDEAFELRALRPTSPLRDRKYDQIKASLNEVVTTQRDLAPASQVADLLKAVQELKTSLPEAPTMASQPSDIKKVVEEAVYRQMRSKLAPAVSSTQAAAEERSSLQIAGLESMLQIANHHLEDETKARRATEDALADSQRSLRQSRHDAAQQRESAEATEAKLQEYYEQRQHHFKHSAMLEGSQEVMEKTVSEIIEKNQALESTIAEYRLSHQQWRIDIEDSRHQNRQMHQTLHSHKNELEGSRESEKALRSHLSRLQNDVASMSQSLAAEYSRQREKEQEHKSRLDLLGARLEAEAKTRERLESEVERLEKQEQSMMTARLKAEQTQKRNTHLDELVTQLRSESHSHQNARAQLQRDLDAAKDIHTMEIHQIRSAMAIDLEAAKSDACLVQARLSDTIARLQKREEELTASAKEVQASRDAALKEASGIKDMAQREAARVNETLLQEQSQIHYSHVEELKSNHQSALDHVADARQRAEAYHGKLLSLANERLEHAQEKIVHLEEKFEIAKSAGQAAVQAAWANKKMSDASSVPATLNQTSSIPEKVSPQALRESILVLQEQLQARESHIEDLEARLAAVDPNALARLKEAGDEIIWLRELLGVRIDDLQDIIQTLSSPSFDRDSVKDAAIRLRANLQMEQQERERSLMGMGTLPGLSGLTNIAASPRALPMAAAAAWGNWRKSRETGSNSMASAASPTKTSASPQAFFAGLVASPSASIRSGAQSQSPGRPEIPLPQGRLRGQALGKFGTAPRSDGRRHPHGPVTPPLMRKSSYDLDAAEAAVFGEAHAEPDTDDPLEDTNRRTYEVAQEEEPFGPRLGTFAA